MEGNKNFNPNEFGDMLKGMMENANKRMEQTLNMLPKSAPKRIAIKTKKAHATQLKDGRILIEFDNPADAKTFFNSLK